MSADTQHLEDVAALAAAGSLPEAERAAFDAHPDAAEALAAWESAVLALADGAPPVAPPSAVKDRLLAAIAPLPAGHVVRQPDAGHFRPTRYAGITVRVLNIDQTAERFACLMRIAPGARLPHHPHAVAEECVVIDGTIRVGGVTMGPGAYQRVEAGVDHLDQWSDTGATVFLNAPLELLEQPG